MISESRSRAVGVLFPQSVAESVGNIRRRVAHKYYCRHHERPEVYAKKMFGKGNMRDLVRFGNVSCILLSKQIYNCFTCRSACHIGASPVEDECLGGAL